MTAVTQETLNALIAQINKANAAQRLLIIETAEVLLAGIQHVGNEHLAVLGLLLEKGIITGAELDAKHLELAAQWQVETALDPRLAELNGALSTLQQMIEQLKANLKDDA